ncbi:MAG: queuosine precursor transporter [Terracidiphilus sp.]|jgi:uncharacterized integral membrane protein (TIGR00697 family)
MKSEQKPSSASVFELSSGVITAQRSYRFLGLLTAAYITMQLVSDVTAGKIIVLGFFPVSVTVLYFPLTYLFGDVLTEVYGYARSRSVIWKVFFASVAAGIIYWIVVLIPPAPGFQGNEAFTRVLGGVPRILVGGWIAVWVGGILNDYVLAKMKIWTNGKYLWTRTVGSTFVSEFANTALFYTIALYAVIPTHLLVASVLSGWLLKTTVEVVLTPWTYWVVGKLKKLEDEDYYDRDTDFNPLIIESE